MKYKAEIISNGKIFGQHYFTSLTHPNQVARHVTKKYRKRINMFILLVMNDVGDVWKFSVMKERDGKLHIRKMEKGSFMLNKNEIDMIFSGNSTMLEMVL